MEAIILNTGFHRKLLIALENDPNPLCYVYIVETFPSDIFFDPFELEEVFEGDRDAVYIERPLKIDLEQPSSLAEGQTVWFRLSRYQDPGNVEYANFNIEWSPKAFQVCQFRESNDAKESNSSSQMLKSAAKSFHGRDEFFPYEIDKYHVQDLYSTRQNFAIEVPIGNMEDQPIVSLVTFSLTSLFTLLLLIVIATKKSKID